MEGKKFIPTVQALKTINGVVEAGGIYKLNDLKRVFPYIDFENKDYFTKIYSCDKYKKSDKVRFTGKTENYLPGLSNKRVYHVTGVSHKVIGDLLYTCYTITRDEDEKSWLVKECELEPSESKWIVSFTNGCSQDHPAVHELDYFAYENGIKESWKRIFVFDTRREALEVADMFSKYSIQEIVARVKTTENNKDRIIVDGFLSNF